MLPAGRYEYPFQHQLKSDLPSSFESKNGHVRYTVVANIDKPWKFDHVTREAFTVLGRLDLNLEDPTLKVWSVDVAPVLHCLGFFLFFTSI